VTKHLPSLAAMALEVVALEAGMVPILHRGLEKIAGKIERTAKSEIGSYQPAVGPFDAWPELAESTEEDKAKQGYPAGAPLLRDGDLRDSYEHQTEGLVALIGSDDDVAVFHEFGTSKMPARPVLGPAAFRNKDVIQKLVGAALVAGIVGEDQVHAALGYDFKTRDD